MTAEALRGVRAVRNPHHIPVRGDDLTSSDDSVSDNGHISVTTVVWAPPFDPLTEVPQAAAFGSRHGVPVFIDQRGEVFQQKCACFGRHGEGHTRCTLGACAIFETWFETDEWDFTAGCSTPWDLPVVVHIH